MVGYHAGMERPSPFVFSPLGNEHLIAFLEAVKDFAENDHPTFNRWFRRDVPWDAGEFRRYVAECENARQDWRPRAGQTSQSHYVLIEREARRVCGHAVLRFPLDHKIEREGGNMAFHVPPSVRGQGFGTLTLNRLLFEGVRAGLARALVVVAEDNVAARRAVEKNRGQFARIGDGGAHYWIHLR